ncbi:hypothetical protein P3687_22690 [Vibrio parahaemolyticus]|uniref:hypothetical protein n=1 Tax=Vibrio parahaemolyticus TaxID=670 RepID=UPI001A8EDF17|nr:hypothetical protein [Vibrio parahaemolyticus]MBO0179458.1 hypothetical protein [Vibrio parahaemolyticus]MDF5361175.1 hypothetical protein [Vibrio parahaemolyticus]MDG2755012.1 hypothetical protein [Vibrio parahaemolyticus]MDG2764313.1 hypothetical protein [Vibrio parahaemolyticus]WKV20135.1 hypothetical protein [Vibrio parahaemolyticus]
MNVIKTKVGIYSVPDNPREPDITATDGIMMYGYRKVREKNGIGYILAHNMKFGYSELAEHKGRWVFVDVSEYWAVTAIIGWTHPNKHNGIKYTGVHCKVLSESDINQHKIG